MNEKELKELEGKIGKQFMEWADNYFADENNFNQKIRKIDLIQHYRNCVDALVLSASIFNKLALYCQYKGYVLNPKHLQDKKGQIRLVVNGRASLCCYIENKGVKKGKRLEKMADRELLEHIFLMNLHIIKRQRALEFLLLDDNLEYESVPREVIVSKEDVFELDLHYERLLYNASVDKLTDEELEEWSNL